MSSLSGMIAQLRLPAPATVTLGSVSKNVCGASARLRVMKVLKTLCFWPCLIPLSSEIPNHVGL